MELPLHRSGSGEQAGRKCSIYSHSWRGRDCQQSFKLAGSVLNAATVLGSVALNSAEHGEELPSVCSALAGLELLQVTPWPPPTAFQD